MSRALRVAAAQLGPNHLTSKRGDILQRMISLLRNAASRGAQIVLFPELAFVTFFARYLIQPEELEAFFEHGDLITSSDTSALFLEAKRLRVDISVGFAERTDDGTGYNTSIYYSASSDSILSKYRKIHLPGTREPFPDSNAINQLEKRYFAPGNLGFTAFRAPNLIPSVLKQSSSQHESESSSPTAKGKGDPILGTLICNDRRWPEAWRCLSLQGTEIVLCGYNTQGYCPELAGTSPSKPETKEEDEAAALADHLLVMQANSYMNSVFSVCAAKAGLEDGKFGLIGGSCIVDPKGKILVIAETRGDEVIVADCDLEEVSHGRKAIFDFARHRRVEAYGLITSRTGVIEPPLL
jgi:predicted amidohydrolase